MSAVGDRIRGLVVRLRRLLAFDRAERDLEEELRHHLDLETRAGVERGLSPKAALREARLRFGGVERYREEARDVRRLGWWDRLRQDARLSWRILASNPGFSAAAIVTLGLGIGANTAIFSVVDAVLLSESPFADPDQLIMVWETDRGSDNAHEPASWPDVADFRERSRTLSAIGAVVGQDYTLSSGAGDPERVAGVAVTPNVPVLLGVRPIVGRIFTPGEGRANDAAVVLLGEEFWRERYGGDPGVVGATLVIEEEPATVVGVLPAGADLGIRQIHDRADYAPSFSGADIQVWAAFQPAAEDFPRQTHPFLTLGRLAPGASLAAAQRELSGIAAELESMYSENAGRGANLEPYTEVVFGGVRRALWVLLGAVGLVLLITCANVANLLLARTASRRREVAVRQALGAPASRIRSQFLVEALVLTGLGAAAGVAVAFAGLALLLALAPADIPRLGQATVDGRVLLYTMAVSTLVAVAFGVLPALQTGRLEVQEALRAQAGRRSSEGRASRRFRGALVVAEVALTVMLVIGAGLMLRSVWEMRRVEPGFDAARVVKAQYQLPDTRYPRDFSRWPDIPEINDFHARFLEAVRSVPGVEAAAIAGGHPLDPGFTNSFTILGRESESADYPEIRTRFLSPGYLETLGVDLVAGRDIRASDDVHSPPVVVINRAAAARYFPKGDPLGQSIRFWGTDRQIVGVIGDERFQGVDRPAEPAAYAPLLQNPQQSATLLVRSEGDPLAVVPEIRRSFRKLDPQLALFDVEPLATTLSESMSRPRFLATLLTLFAGLSILLALVGVHGVLSYTVARRAPEVGIRMAMGATRARVMGAVMGEGLALAALGVVVGMMAALAGSHLLGSLVFGVTTTDPATFVAVPALVLATAAAASARPAWRAARGDPLSALRAD